MAPPSHPPSSHSRWTDERVLTIFGDEALRRSVILVVAGRPAGKGATPGAWARARPGWPAGRRSRLHCSSGRHAPYYRLGDLSIAPVGTGVRCGRRSDWFREGSSPRRRRRESLSEELVRWARYVFGAPPAVGGAGSKRGDRWLVAVCRVWLSRFSTERWPSRVSRTLAGRRGRQNSPPSLRGSAGPRLAHRCSASPPTSRP